MSQIPHTDENDADASDESSKSGDRPGKRTATGLPKPPGKNLNPGEFFDYLRLFEARDFAHVEIYVYSPWPVLLDERDPKYIDKLSQFFDDVYLLQEHGSGDYYFSLNDTDIRGSQRTVVCVPKSRPLSLRDPAYPPKRRLEDIAWNDPANKTLKNKLIREGKMSATGELIQPAGGSAGEAGVLKDAFVELLKERRQPQASNNLETQTLTRVLDMMGQASSKSIEIALSQVRQESPEGFMKLLGLVKDLLGDRANSGGNDKLLELLMKQNADLQKQNGDLLLRLVDNKPKSLAETVEEFRALKEVFGGEDGPSARSPLGKWGALVEALAPAAPAILSTLGSFLRPPMLPGQPGAPQPTGAPSPYQPPPGPPASNPTTAPAQPGGAADPTHQLAAPVDPNVNPAVVQQIVSFLPIVDAVIANYINQGRSGDEFAEWLADSYGEIAYNQVRSAGPDNLKAALRHSPQLGAIAQAAPAVWEQFIHDFLNPPPPDDPPVDPPTEPEPATPAKKRTKEAKA